MKDLKKRQRAYIVGALVALSVAVTLVDALIKPTYAIKASVKLVFFLIIPLFYFVLNRGELERFKKLFRMKKETMIRAIVIGLLIYGLILGGYFLLRGVIDFSNVTNVLKENHGVTGDNFIYVATYIALLNSFLEEFFFRGFGFITLKHHVSRKTAYLLSSGMFAVYHVGMLLGMFDLWVLPLLFAGLLVGGCIFNWLNETSENIYTSWVSHMFANFAINTVGFLLFGML